MLPGFLCVIVLWSVQVSLMKQMERSHKDFLDWRREREKEVLQLRRQASHNTAMLPAA